MTTVEGRRRRDAKMIADNVKQGLLPPSATEALRFARKITATTATRAFEDNFKFEMPWL